ncbi:uncharacterized protein FFB20_09149 [Fusarium fujikuroi]|nr:uncharacterized protein FFB20_09149 [Fusarium fujikuroi]SCO24098.1 uncharacterized protein FFE2_15874 [Fusarium fujikuroi]SCO25649.1 uncharacterized protein FFC1_15639 [Fusarium fujikuroi]SCO26844.1 uncharacterized protein FFM5_15113 [Fusarium fujikuroi]SCO53928.1 uncharacterized protein FFNC_15259 [Fusarium fujikuroi]
MIQQRIDACRLEHTNAIPEILSHRLIETNTIMAFTCSCGLII